MKKLLVLLLSLSLAFCCACGSDTNTATDVVSDEFSDTVYVTKTGGKYHSDGCLYLKKSCIEKDLSEAESQGYTPCSVCR